MGHCRYQPVAAGQPFLILSGARMDKGQFRRCVRTRVSAIVQSLEALGRRVEKRVLERCFSR